MQTPIPWTVIAVGVLLVIIATLADSLGLGRHAGFGWRQGRGVVIGALVIVAGLYLRHRLRASR